MKKHLLTLALAVVTMAASAQNSALYKIDELIQKGDLVAAAALCDEAIANPKTTKFQELYNKAGQVQLMTFTPELMKASSRVHLDTVVFCTTLDRAVGFYTKSFEASQALDSKGKPVKVEQKIQADTHDRLMAMVDFYNYAAMFCYVNGDQAHAIEYFQKYVDYPQNPAFTQAQRDSLETLNAEAYAQTHFNLCLLYYETKNWEHLFSEAPASLKTNFNNHDVYVMLKDAHVQMGDSAKWEQTLIDAATIEGDVGFFNELVSYYAQTGQKEKAVNLVNEMVAKKPQEPVAWFMKGAVESDILDDIEAARKSYQKAIELNPKYTEAYINMGTTYYNEIAHRSENHEFDHFNRGYFNHETEAVFMQETRTIRDIYLEACKYLEKARESAPENPDLWGRRLQRVYNHLRIVYENLDDKATAAEYQNKYDEVGALCE